MTTSHTQPIFSMTGFGRALLDFEGLPVYIEIKSVNHRYHESRIRVPRDLGDLEFAIRERLQQAISRGRIEVSVRVGEGQNEILTQPSLDIELAARYLELYAQLSQHFLRHFSTNDPPLQASQLFLMPGVLATRPSQQRLENLSATILAALPDALASLLQMREREGLHLKQDLVERISRLESLIDEIAKRAPLLAQTLFTRQKERLHQLFHELSFDDTRLQQEIALIVDRGDITEEITRIKSHFQQFRTLLHEGGVIGRRLDFLCQEMHREANTIGSKNQDVEHARILISLKAEIEKLREQVQNIE